MSIGTSLRSLLPIAATPLLILPPPPASLSVLSPTLVRLPAHSPPARSDAALDQDEGDSPVWAWP